jgi:hypothetical protein
VAVDHPPSGSASLLLPVAWPVSAIPVSAALKSDSLEFNIASINAINCSKAASRCCIKAIVLLHLTCPFWSRIMKPLHPS